MSHALFLDELISTLGAEVAQRGDDVPARYHTDWSGTPPQRPLALVRPRSTDEVSALMRLCTAHRVPVVPQGGLTGLAGAAVPVAGAVAVSMERMNAIEDVNARTALMTVQAGATLQAVQEAAVAAGMVFGVDLGARGSCQIGGNVATNAGGNGVLQHGMMREQVLGLEVVLADGTVLPMLRPMLKNNTGYDLKQFFIGSEGTLGIVTRVLLRLRPAPGRPMAVILPPLMARACTTLSLASAVMMRPWRRTVSAGAASAGAATRTVAAIKCLIIVCPLPVERTVWRSLDGRQAFGARLRYSGAKPPSDHRPDHIPSAGRWGFQGR